MMETTGMARTETTTKQLENCEATRNLQHPSTEPSAETTSKQFENVEAGSCPQTLVNLFHQLNIEDHKFQILMLNPVTKD